MGKDAVLHVRIDTSDKIQAETIYENLGTSLSEATRMFVKQSIKANGFPFKPTNDKKKGKLSAQGALRMYAHREMRESEREAWIRSLSDKYESFNR